MYGCCGRRQDDGVGAVTLITAVRAVIVPVAPPQGGDTLRPIVTAEHVGPALHLRRGETGIIC